MVKYETIVLLNSCWNHGHIDVGDGCLRPNMLATTLRYWWRFQPFCHQNLLTLASVTINVADFFVMMVIFQCFKLVTNILDRSTISQTCHQHIWSQTSVTNIDVTKISVWKPASLQASIFLLSHDYLQNIVNVELEKDFGHFSMRTTLFWLVSLSLWHAFFVNINRTKLASFRKMFNII